MKNANSYRSPVLSKVFGNKLARAVVAVSIATIVAVFSFMPVGVADSDCKPEDSQAREASPMVYKEPKLPAEWVWRQKTINFDHMFRVKR